MIIQSNQDLEKFCKLASRKKVLFIDTEFDRRNTYYSELSFISVYDGTKFWLIDCLTGIKVEALSKVLSNKKITKVLHGSQQDLEIFKHLQLPLNSLFDTQTAAQFCGFEQPISYANAVLKICKVSLDKQLQNSDWLKRPVNKKTIEYLKNDVKYLKPLYTFFLKELKKNKNFSYFNEEMSIIDRSSHTITSSLIRKKMNSNTINNKSFQSLLHTREQLAQKKNLPKNWIFPDSGILTIIKNKEYKDIKENKNLTFQEKKMFINKFKKIKVQKNNNKITNDNIIKLINIIRSEVSKSKNISEQLISNKNDTIAYLEDGLKKNSKWREKIFYKITDQLVKKNLKIKIKKNTIAF